MKILWVVNIELPQLKRTNGKQLKGSGGWLEQMADELAEKHDLIVLYPKTGALCRKQVSGIEFVTFNCVTEKNLNKSISYFQDVLQDSKPDVIHIWGTECIHSYAMVEAAEKCNKLDSLVIWIQGLVSVYAKHYMGEVPYCVQNSATIRDRIRRDSLKLQQKRMRLAGEYEIKALQKAKHVIGRTRWDYICCNLINKNACYHYNGETLRKAFYTGADNSRKTIKGRVFVTQGHYPIKGLHILLEAIAILKEYNPDIRLHIGGHDNAFKAGLKENGYSRYIKQLIMHHQLEDVVNYVGLLGEAEIIRELSEAEVFVSPSVIENSSNAIGEAMIMGLPVVASDVGGTADMVEDGKEGILYQWDSPEMLASAIMCFLDSKELQERMSLAAKQKALTRHDSESNFNRLVETYKEIAK